MLGLLVQQRCFWSWCVVASHISRFRAAEPCLQAGHEEVARENRVECMCSYVRRLVPFPHFSFLQRAQAKSRWRGSSLGLEGGTPGSPSYPTPQDRARSVCGTCPPSRSFPCACTSSRAHTRKWHRSRPLPALTASKSALSSIPFTSETPPESR